MKLLVLYTELADYFLSVLNSFQDENLHCEILLIHYPINPEAPFQLEIHNQIKSIEFTKKSREIVTNSINFFNPNVILCSGWANKEYLKFCFWSKVKNNSKNILCFDTIWNKQFKQYLMMIISRIFFKNIFSNVWVPGPLQKKYAMLLGFYQNHINEGFYVANQKIYKQIGQKKLLKNKPYPKNFICIARYIPNKNLDILFKAFINVNQKVENKWKLMALGQGELFDKRILDDNIEHLGFVQPMEMENILINAGVSVLPSLFEPWAVAVHEMCMSALPIVLSERVGSADVFLKGENGFSFNPLKQTELESTMLNIMNMSDDELWKMAQISYENANIYNAENWKMILKNYFN